MLLIISPSVLSDCRVSKHVSPSARTTPILRPPNLILPLPPAPGPRPLAPMNVIEVDRVSKRFAGHVAVDTLSLAVPQGGIFGLLGPNGAGKSTTIRMILDILIPDEGSISLFGQRDGARKQSARIGFLPEERGLYPRMLVLDSLISLGQMRGLDRANARHRALWWLNKVGLSDWSKRKVQDLSKGMQQKVQLVGALLHDPDLLVLDEPFSGLDPVNAQVLQEAVLELSRNGKTILFSTHQRSEER